MAWAGHAGTLASQAGRHWDNIRLGGAQAGSELAT